MHLAQSWKDVMKEGNWTEEIESIISDIYIDDAAQIKNRYSKLQGIHQLQKSIVRQNMHNAMSPISAISGYLELINMSLSQEPDVDQIEYYRKKIEYGIQEVNNIIEQLQGIYRDELDNTGEEKETLLDVDLNWIVRQVIENMHCGGEHTTFTTNVSPLHIKTDLFITKLIIFNLISYASKSSPKGEMLELETSKDKAMATFLIKFNISENRKKELNNIVSGNAPANGIDSFAEGLLTSVELADQVQGCITFMSVNDSVGMLKLSIPLTTERG
ncbi:MAG: HAMP domain-containing histidine kinase [Balneolaceae bacterium]|nr:HAMP domain-containing histidine kinase [Balneolaceae bacterium]